MSPRRHCFARESDEINKPPQLNIRYFYASPLPIDDPLSPVPPPTTSNSVPSKLAPRPFSEYDSTQLDQAWSGLRHKLQRYREERDLEKAAAKRALGVQDERKRSGQYSVQESRTWPRDVSRSRSRQGSTPIVGSPGTSLGTELSAASVGRARAASKASIRPSLTLLDPSLTDGVVGDGGSDGLTGMPFLRAPSRKKIPSVSEQTSMNFDKETSEVSATPPRTPAEPELKVPVGVSRLHHVVMPKMTMEPIYWNPVNDIATVIRGTWFYADNMLPVEVDIANLLEAGYLSLQAWTNTWQDQLDSAIEAGAAGEEKILHPLWHADIESRPSTAMSTAKPLDESTPEEKRQETLTMACDIIDASVGTELDTKAAGSLNFGQDGISKLYLRSGIIYANAKQAYILRPNLQPSAYYARRPLANYIRRGHNIGIPVVRGFVQETWDKLNPVKGGRKVVSAQQGVSTSQAGRPGAARLKSDPALSKAERPQVTDLILVIHGIGQKLSERMESFHFTHAMNGFRREVNVELGSDSVKTHLSPDAGGIMVLPVNWRSTLKFEEGGYRDENEDDMENHYSLPDIVPDTLPSVRGIISDVMLDIPYYLSHHQQSMITAVTKEANKVYRLWCLNNPGFEQYGRVHLIAHSLGSVMAIDILSKQPTTTPTSPALVEELPHLDHFSFRTHNLYLCGSPAGLFLMLKQANIIPRKNVNKPGVESTDYTPGVAAEQGTYGCLAVNNIYNIIHPYDPVALKLNPTVDTTHAAALKSTKIPSTTTSWFAFSNPLSKTRSPSSSNTSTFDKPSLPARLPSNVELETHNFTREELAEKRFQLLNDNGSVDYFLRAGGGALEFQYLTMLGAHSSYWLSRDFTRFIVVETGRVQGRNGTLVACRAVKKRGVHGQGMG